MSFYTDVYGNKKRAVRRTALFLLFINSCMSNLPNF